MGEWSWSAREAVAKRVSERTYDGRALDPELRDAVRSRLAHHPPAPFGTPVRLTLVEVGSGPSPVRLGTYGMIRGAPAFLVGAATRGPRAEEDFGFVFQWAILMLTAMGLGTCWLGGTLRRDQFAAAVGLGTDEFIPAVSPVGYPAPRRSVVDRLTRWGAGSRGRKPWEALFFRDRFGLPLAWEEAGEYAQVLEAVRWGPSASNRQPWRVVREGPGETYHLFLQRTPGYPSVGVDLQRLDMGIAMCHFQLVAQELGLEGRWAHTPPPLDLPPRTSYVTSWIPQT